MGPGGMGSSRCNASDVGGTHGYAHKTHGTRPGRHDRAAVRRLGGLGDHGHPGGEAGRRRPHGGRPVRLRGRRLGRHGLRRGWVSDGRFGRGGRAVYVYAGSGWTQAQRLTGTDGAASAGFGLALAAQGDTLVVGAPGATENGVPFGAVYVYKNVAGVWTLEQRLMASDPRQMAAFGHSVALDGDQLVVGCPSALTLGPKVTLGTSIASGAAWTCSPAPVASGARRPSSRRRRPPPP